MGLIGTIPAGNRTAYFTGCCGQHKVVPGQQATWLRVAGKESLRVRKHPGCFPARLSGTPVGLERPGCFCKLPHIRRSRRQPSIKLQRPLSHLIGPISLADRLLATPPHCFPTRRIADQAGQFLGQRSRVVWPA